MSATEGNVQGQHAAWHASYSPLPANADLVPTKERNWHTRDILCMWMSDVHNVGGCAFAAGLFFLGLTGSHVLIALIVGIPIVDYCMNRMGVPDHRTGVPYPVFARVSFGVFGANIAPLPRSEMSIVSRVADRTSPRKR